MSRFIYHIDDTKSGDYMLKMVFLVNMELGMGKGKMCAQVAHAATLLIQECVLTGSDRLLDLYLEWMNTGQKKIVLKVPNLQELEAFEEKLHDNDIYLTAKVHDFGLTQIAPNSVTVLGIGPVEESEVDAIVSELKLL